MTGAAERRVEQVPPLPGNATRHAAWFHELDAWTEYWDVYQPQTNGRFYFGDGGSERGLLTCFLPREGRPPPFIAWTKMALNLGSVASFEETVLSPDVALAVREVDDLMTRLFARHFGDARDSDVRRDYLEAIFAFATDALPPTPERESRLPDDDPRKRTAGRHTLDGDIMWFGWALHTEAAGLVGEPAAAPRRSLVLAGIAMGCAANFAWRGHRRTREEYAPDDATAALLKARAQVWADDSAAAAREIHALFRIREWGSPE